VCSLGFLFRDFIAPARRRVSLPIELSRWRDPAIINLSRPEFANGGCRTRQKTRLPDVDAKSSTSREMHSLAFSTRDPRENASLLSIRSRCNSGQRTAAAGISRVSAEIARCIRHSACERSFRARAFIRFRDKTLPRSRAGWSPLLSEEILTSTMVARKTRRKTLEEERGDCRTASRRCGASRRNPLHFVAGG
jgi:hypothetical protein